MNGFLILTALGDLFRRIDIPLDSRQGKELITFFFVLGVGVIIVRVISWSLRTSVYRWVKNWDGDPTGIKFLTNFSIFFLYFLAVATAIYSVPSLRTVSISLFAGAGVLAAILGFASQAAFSNIISGLFIVWFKPFRVRDWVTVGDRYEGIVEDITIRHTVIRDFQNQRIIIPNSTISAMVVINQHLYDQQIRRFIELTVEHGTDVRKALQIMEDIVRIHPLWLDVRTEPEAEENVDPIPHFLIRMTDLGPRLRIVAWTRNPDDAFILHTECLMAIYEAFQAEGIRIARYAAPQPAPQN
jgi:small-conductance mechanosensitive channel